MTFRNWRSLMTRLPTQIAYLTCTPLPLPLWPAPESTTLQRHPAGILTQWAFHRVQEHPKWSSDEEVMTFRSWRSLMTRLPTLTAYLTCPNSPFPLVPEYTTLQIHAAGILTQWAFHRVQEHPNRSSDEKVMTFRS